MNMNRWLRLRHPDGFSEEQFEGFKAGCRLWDSYVQAHSKEMKRIGELDKDVHYVCGEPELSVDKKIASLPISGECSTTSLDYYENCASHLLREFLFLFPSEKFLGLEEGLTQDNRTDWRNTAQNLAEDLRRFKSYRNAFNCISSFEDLEARLENWISFRDSDCPPYDGNGIVYLMLACLRNIEKYQDFEAIVDIEECLRGKDLDFLAAWVDAAKKSQGEAGNLPST